jgi:hypothetical protein
MASRYALWGLGVAFVNEPGVTRLVLSPIVYTLNFGGATGGTAYGQGEQPRLERATIAFNAAASVVKTAIVGIDDSILAADVTVTGSAGVYTVTVPGVLTVATAPPSQVVPLPR